MSKKSKEDEYEKIYKTLTKDKFINIMMNLDMLNKALGHLAWKLYEIDPVAGNTLQIPLEVPKKAVFRFEVYQNKVTKQEILSVGIVKDEKTILQ